MNSTDTEPLPPGGVKLTYRPPPCPVDDLDELEDVGLDDDDNLSAVCACACVPGGGPSGVKFSYAADPPAPLLGRWPEFPGGQGGGQDFPLKGVAPWRLDRDVREE